MGANTNTPKFDIPGIIVSLNINLNASANGCNNPHTPTMLGPTLRWTPAKTLRSTNVNNAIAKIVKNGIITTINILYFFYLL